MQLKTIPEDFIVVEIAKHQPKPEGQYALLELTKRNMTTERAIAELGEFLKLQRKAFGYAGTKDARALTKQYVTVRARPEEIERLAKFKRANIVVRALGYVDQPLSLGMLDGNRFEIVVRKIEHERASPRTQIPNYFDEQRFSSSNAQIGKLIIKGDFKAAAELIISTDPDAGVKMREHLAEHPNDAITAMRHVPRNTLLLYVHAYQSLLFNEALRAYLLQHDAGARTIDGSVPLVVPSKELANVQIPIFGFGTEADPMFGSLYAKILEREGLTPRDFVIRSLPFLALEGDERDAFFSVGNLEIGEPEPDDLHDGYRKQRLTFLLPKGCYATLAIKIMYGVGRVLGEKSASSE